MLFQIAININESKYSDLKCDTLAERLKKAKLMAGFSQRTLANATGLNLSTISALESNSRDNITRDTLLKLLRVLDRNVLCDDYCNYILNQKNEFKKLLHIYSINDLAKMLNIHRTTVERLRDEKYQISRKQFKLICNLKNHEK